MSNRNYEDCAVPSTRNLFEPYIIPTTFIRLSALGYWLFCRLARLAISPPQHVRYEPGQIGGAFGETAHQVEVPVRTIGRGHEQSVSRPRQLDLILS